VSAVPCTMSRWRACPKGLCAKYWSWNRGDV
jgi:hypothetical protein